MSFKKMKEKTKEIFSITKQTVHDVQNIEMPDGSVLKWKVQPKINFKNPLDTDKLMQSKLTLEWEKEFKEDDVKITVSVNGKIVDLISAPGSKDFKANFVATKRF